MRHSIPNIAERFFEWKKGNHDTIRGLCGPMRSWYRKKRWMAPSRHRPYHLTDEWWTNQIQCERGIKCASCWVRNMDDSHTRPWLQGTEYLGSFLETTCATALLSLEKWKLWQLFCCLVVPRFIPHSQNLWRSKIHPSWTNVTNPSLFSVSLDNEAKKSTTEASLRLRQDRFATVSVRECKVQIQKVDSDGNLSAIS